MTTKSISDQIIDGFLAKALKSECIGEDSIIKLKLLFGLDKIKKNDIVKILKEEGKDENP